MPLGTLRSWMRDGLLAGGLLPPSALLALLLVLIQLDGGPGPGTLQFAAALAVSSLSGAFLALLLTPVSWWAASLAWKIPLLSLLLGPLLGGGCAWASFWMTAIVVDGREPSLRLNELLLVGGLGAVAVGPPWMAYLAVRARGRSGLPIVAASILWGACCSAALVLLVWARSLWLVGRW